MIKKSEYLFLYLNTGAGHISSAKTIAKYFNENYNEEINVTLVDGFTEINKLVKYIVEDGYRISQAKAKWVFEGLYALNKIDAQANGTNKTISYFVREYLQKLIEKQKPDKIVVFHFFLVKPILKILKSLNLNIPVVTVVTDPFTAPKIWFTEKNSQYIVFSERAEKQAISKMGVPKEKVHVFPFIINDKFDTKPNDEQLKEIRRMLGFAPDKKLTVIIGGGDGMPRSKKIIKQLVKQNVDTEIAVVCGRNKDLYDDLTTRLKYKKIGNLTVFDFIDFVYELLSVADFVICKGGPSSIFEILAMGKIPIVNTYIWEQEKGNVEYVTKNNLGYYEPDVKRLPLIINELINDENKLNEMKKNIKKQNITNGTKQVSEFLISKIYEPVLDLEEK